MVLYYRNRNLTARSHHTIHALVLVNGLLSQVFYYTQCEARAPEASTLPSNAVCCGSTVGSGSLGLIGYQASVDAAEAAFRRHFPDLRWLSDLEAIGDGNDGGRGGPGVGDDERDAVEELQAALELLEPVALGGGEQHSTTRTADGELGNGARAQ